MIQSSKPLANEVSLGLIERKPASIENDPLFCDYTENEVPCPKCLQDGKNGILNVNSIEEDGKRKLYALCNICDFKKSFFKF